MEMLLPIGQILLKMFYYIHNIIVVLKVDNKVLTENKDYTVTYINNINAGSPAEVIV